MRIMLAPYLPGVGGGRYGLCREGAHRSATEKGIRSHQRLQVGNLYELGPLKFLTVICELFYYHTGTHRRYRTYLLYTTVGRFRRYRMASSFS